MKLGLAIEAVAVAEGGLARGLLAVGERHRAEHDVFHLTRTLAAMERGHVESLAPHAERYGASLGSAQDSDDGISGLVRTAAEKGAELVGRRPEPALELLRDLRELHVLAAGCSLDWTVLGQGAQAARDERLLATVTICHAQTIRTLKWTTERVKDAAPQVLTA